MPKKVPDYSNSSIYKLVHKEDFDNENIYIGSTTNFIKRKNSHKTKCNKENNKNYNLKLYQYIRQNGGWNNWTMIQIQPYSCASKKELETEERRFIELLKAKLNSYIPTRTKEEYYYDNRDEYLENTKKYYINNLDEKLKYAKQYNINNRDEILEKKKQKVICDNCGCEITKCHLLRHKRTQKCINFNSK